MTKTCTLKGPQSCYSDLCLHPKLLSNLADSMERPEPSMKLRRQVPPSRVSLLSNFIHLSFYFYSFGYHELPCTINIVYMWIFQLFSTLISVLWEQSPCFECLNSLFSFHCLVNRSFYFHTQLSEVTLCFLKLINTRKGMFNLTSNQGNANENFIDFGKIFYIW